MTLLQIQPAGSEVGPTLPMPVQITEKAAEMVRSAMEQEELVDHVMRDVGLIAPILGRRAMYQFGMRLPVSDEGTVGAGLGPPQRLFSL